MPLKDAARFAVSHLQVLDEQGRVDEKLDPKLPDADLVKLYEAMTLAREADQRMLKLQRQGRMGTFPLSTGQEAAVCGVAFAMREQDWFVPSYRELGAMLMRGYPLLQYMRYWNGYEEGNTLPEKGRNLPIAAIVGSQALHAVGVAYATRLRREPAAVVTYFGDGASSEGDVLEAMNFAGVWQAPVVFVCMNNQWAISLPREAQTRAETIAQKAIAFGFEGIQVDGNDVLAVYKATNAALERARAGGGPTLIEAITYRLMMHTTADDPKRYRPEDEVAEEWKKDPLARLKTLLERRGIWNDDLQGGLEAKARRAVEEAVAALEEPYPIKPDAAFDHVFAQPTDDLEAQRAEFLAEVHRAAGEASHG
ncbi:MAG: pyruvate dehydrogenase (acetyl-transferring) E1 component subunit alpha [Deltaproteobacteria bacterium]|nr:pyruvate dehydrogenase (acetyl-transferring) E1 component subunit alpha [Deltaproteobacteria bacterium]